MPAREGSANGSTNKLSVFGGDISNHGFAGNVAIPTGPPSIAHPCSSVRREKHGLFLDQTNPREQVDHRRVPPPLDGGLFYRPDSMKR